MSNALGHVVHAGEIVGYFEYQGSSCQAASVIYPTNTFKWRSKQANKCTCGKPPVDVLLWTEYGGGFYWESLACLACSAIVGERCHFELDTIDGHPLGPDFETVRSKRCRGEA